MPADDAFNDKIAKEVAPHDYVRPEGVEFYMDSAQSNPDSSLNIGLFQFSPDVGGETQACIDKWNAHFTNAPFPRNLTEADLIRATGSSLQFFNAWCGVTKVSDMFAVQANTNQSKSTALANISPNGKLFPAAQRCVTPFFGTWSYNHFGSLQNSLGNTLAPMLQCALRGL